jgi:hypothetical protein
VLILFLILPVGARAHPPDVTPEPVSELETGAREYATSLKRSSVGFGPNMAMIVSSEKPRTNTACPAALVRTLGRGGRAKVRPTMDSTGSV